MVWCLGQDELTDDIDIELDLVGLQDGDKAFEELTRQLLGFLGVTEVEVKHSTTTVDGVDDVVGVVTGKDEPTVVLELLNQSTDSGSPVSGCVHNLLGTHQGGS